MIQVRSASVRGGSRGKRPLAGDSGDWSPEGVSGAEPLTHTIDTKIELRSREARAMVKVGLALAVWGCHPVAPEAPLRREFGSFVPCTGLSRVPTDQVRAVFAQGYAGTLSPEAGPTRTVDVLTVVTHAGDLVFSDIVHPEDRSQVYVHCKLDPASLAVAPIAGSVSGGWVFTPARDVLQSLDSGFGLTVRAGGVVEHLVYPPRYDTAAYSPFDREAPPKPPGDRGSSPPPGGRAAGGARGEDGEDGEDGGDGGDGDDGALTGQSGGDGGGGGAGSPGVDGAPGAVGAPGGDGTDAADGGDGGDGGDGFRGGPGGDGFDGARGEDGPSLDIVFRPIRSRFYPDEELVFAEVVATWSGGYRTERLNYVFHPRQGFRFRSVGGAGGDGGQGGRGGDGGDGGAGGPGGPGGPGGLGGAGGPAGTVGTPTEGVPAGSGGEGGDGGDGGRGGRGGSGSVAGCGGDGANGGRAGDGGDITVTIEGSPAFRATVRQWMQFESIPGPPGRGGARGDAGESGSGGPAGPAGPLGEGGDGGAGSFAGPTGEDGDDGDPGVPGRSAFAPSCSNRDGAPGGPGRPKPVEIR
jgi:hypothetical protein